jgi:hypothetical protein
MARGRRPVVGYYHCRGAYYTQYRNKKYRLVVGPRDAPNGPTFLAALEEFKRLLTLDQAERLKGRNPVRLVVGEYFRHIRERRKATSVLAREKALRRFLHDHGDVPVGDVTHLLIYDFCDRLKVPRYDEKAKRGCVWGDSGIGPAPARSPASASSRPSCSPACSNLPTPACATCWWRWRTPGRGRAN